MKHLFRPAALLSSLLLSVAPALAQVTLVSPEEGRRAIKNLPREAPARPAAPPPALPEPTLRAAPAPARLSRSTILPEQFGGWVGGTTAAFGPYNAATLAGADAPILVECGFAGAERKRYRREGQTLEVEALRFKDSSGSYGVYTFYRNEEWETKDTGAEQIAVRGGQLLLRKDEVLVRARLFGGAAATDGRWNSAELQALTAALATQGGGPLPTLPRYLPEKGLILKSRKYILGPQAFARVAPDWPAALVDFNMGAEAVVARYGLAGATPATMLLLSYPTPQLAASKVRSWQQSAAPGSSASPAAVLYVRRSGPLVALVAGAASSSDAEALLKRVSYSLEVMWNEPVDKRRTLTPREFIINIVTLTGALLGFALVSGLVLGLLRVILQAWYPHQVFDRLEETEIIRLNINYSK